jgi:hypothetical protein
MKEKFDVRQGMRVFNKVQTHGEALGAERALLGIIASADFDGYTLRLHDSCVDTYIYFHNSFRIESESSNAMGSFLERMQIIDDTDYPITGSTWAENKHSE